MDSLLNPKEYEMLGNIEVRADDWARLKKLGFFKFVTNFISCSPGARIGGWALFFAIASALEKHSIDPFSWYLMLLGLVGIGGSIVYSVKAWSRLIARFPEATEDR